MDLSKSMVIDRVASLSKHATCVETNYQMPLNITSYVNMHIHSFYSSKLSIIACNNDKAAFF